MARSEFPVAVRKAALKRCTDAAGVMHCENQDAAAGWKCGAVLTVGKYQVDHILADGLGGKPVLANAMVLCTPCHIEKTQKQDRPKMQKADNVKAFHEGTRAAPKQQIRSRNNLETREKVSKFTDPFPNLPRRVVGQIV